MAGTSEPLDSVSSLKLEETLNCPICLEVYTTPKALACLHTFCETCLHAHITKLSETGELNGKIYCPVCRVASPPPDRNKPPSDWARLLPMNYAILPILETVQSKERDITTFIVEKSGKHAVSVDFCDEHPGKAITYFCEEHGMLLCSRCVIVSHRPCNKVTELKEMGRDLRKGNDIKKLQTELKAVQPVLEGITKALEDNVIQIEEEADALPNRIKELQDEAMKIFDDLYQRVLTQCNNLKKTYTLKVSNDASNCKSLVAAVESSLITLANVKENGSDIQLFITFHKLEQQMKKYQESLDKMVTDTECTKLELKVDITLEQAVSQQSHIANVTAHQFTPDVIAAMKTAMGTEDAERRPAFLNVEEIYYNVIADVIHSDQPEWEFAYEQMRLGCGGAGGGGGCGGACYNFNNTGHMARDYPEKSYGGRGGGGGGRRGQGQECYNCHEEGHIAHDCPEERGGGGRGQECYNCHEEGHIARDCPEQRSGGDGGRGDSMCYNCHEFGHFARDCPDGGGEDCYNCGEVGHFARECPEGANYRGGVGDCYQCGYAGHFARDCPYRD